MNLRSLYALIGIIPFLLESCSQKTPEQEKLIKVSVANFNSSHYTEAIKGFDKLIQLDSTDYVSWSFRGKTLFLLKRDDEALYSFNKALSINPKYNDGYADRSTYYSLKGQSEQALQDINIALKGNPDDTSFLLIRSWDFIKSNKFDSAILDCNHLLKIDPKNSEAFYNRAFAFKGIGNFDKALMDLNSAIEINPKAPGPYNDRGYILLSQLKYALAIPDFTKSIQLARVEDSSIKAYSYNNRGFCQYKFGNLEEALNDVNTSIQILPGNSYAYKNRALIYLGMKRNSEACADLELSLKLGFIKKYGNEVLTLQSKNCK